MKYLKTFERHKWVEFNDYFHKDKNRDVQFYLDIIKDDKKYFMKFISMDNEAGVYQKLLKIVSIKYNRNISCGVYILVY